MKKCFECGATEDLHEHHVVPKSKGGTKTVTLCYQCHCKAHGRDGKGLNHSRLTRGGLKKVKQQGIKLGTDNPIIREGLIRHHKQRGKTTFERLYPEVIEAQKDLTNQGIKPTFRAVAKLLNKKGISTPSGKGLWQATTVHRIVKRVTMEKVQ